MHSILIGLNIQSRRNAFDVGGTTMNVFDYDYSSHSPSGLFSDLIGQVLRSLILPILSLDY
jgi:hypothetical protein